MKRRLNIFLIAIFFLLLTVSCTNNKNKFDKSYKEKDLSKFFDEYEGSFILFDQNKGEYLVYNKLKSEKRISPCSTFKIYNSLIALESKVIKDEKHVIKWSGKKYPIKSWNKDHTMESAISNSVVWYYQNLASRVGNNKMQKYLKKLDYGNEDISAGIKKFWLQSSLKISPREQVEMLIKFFKNDLPFSKRNIDIVKKIIVLSDENGKILSGKTGTGVVKEKAVSGWFIGYIEANDNVYFFTTNIQSKDGAFGYKAKEITMEILKEILGISAS